ncbi:MAG: cation:proton antiporter [Blastocatellia bacterium]|nr:cation:proton antiporter [Blastocatellia bacterium]
MNLESIFTGNPFVEFAIILFLAALLGAVGQLLRQPLIVVFIALGILVGPSVLNIVESRENIHLLAEIGIAILLFIVGLKLDLRLIKSTGKIALFTGLGQVIFTSVIGFGIGILLGFSTLHSFYIAVALTFSSTIIIVKLLSDKKEIDSLHGQIAVGFLIVQDIVVILVMIILSALGRQGEASVPREIGRTVISSAVLLAITFVMIRWIIPLIGKFLARSPELLTLFSIAWAVALAAFSILIGFSAEVGAFLAGVCLATSPYKDAISGRLVSLRDFLLLFFFVNLGANLDLAAIGGQIPAAVIFSLFVLIGNPIIVLIIMGFMGYRKRTAFLAGLTVAQISEFSLIFAGLGLQVGHIDEETVGLITLVGLITIGISTYLILYSGPIYERLSPFLRVFERSHPFREDETKLKEKKEFDVIIFGLGRFGGSIADSLDHHPDVSYIGIDFDPQVVHQRSEREENIIYGDLEDPELLEHVPYETAKCIVSTVPESSFSVGLLHELKERGYKGRVFVTAAREADLEVLEKTGHEHILMPHRMAAENLYSILIEKVLADKDDDEQAK